MAVVKCSFIRDGRQERSVIKLEHAKQYDIDVNGTCIHAQVIGFGEPLLLLMGLGASGEKWRDNVEEYKKSFTCIMVDNQGAGRSDKPYLASYSVPEMADNAIAVLDALGYDSVHVNGISMGGAIAQEIAIRYPSRVRSLILTSTFCYVTDTFRAALEFLRDCTGLIDRSRLKRLNQWMTFSQKTQNERPEFLINMAKEDAADPWPMPVHAYKAQCNACLAVETRDRLYEIKAPTLIAAGDSDLFVPLSVTRLLHESIKGSQLYICENGGHVHEWEYLDAYNNVTMEFLLKHSGEK